MAALARRGRDGGGRHVSTMPEGTWGGRLAMSPTNPLVPLSPLRPRDRRSWIAAVAWLVVQLVVPATQLTRRPARFGWHMFADVRDVPVLVGVAGPRGTGKTSAVPQPASRDTLNAATFLAARRGDLGADFDRRLVAHICSRRPEYAAIEEYDPSHAHGPPVRVTVCQ